MNVIDFIGLALLIISFIYGVNALWEYIKSRWEEDEE